MERMLLYWLTPTVHHHWGVTPNATADRLQCDILDIATRNHSAVIAKVVFSRGRKEKTIGLVLSF